MGSICTPRCWRSSFAAAGDRVVAVTPAMTATGLGPGRYELGQLEVVVDADHRVTLVDHNQTLAGSVLIMDRAVATLLAAGVPLRAAVAAAPRTPADLLGERRKGRLGPGADDDLVVLA